MRAGGRNVTALRYNKSSRSLSRIRPPRAHAVTLHSPDLEGANMPSRTLTPDLLPSPEPSPSPEPPPSVEPPPSPGPPPSPELPGLRLIKVPDAAPPYDCEIHGTACAAMHDVADVGPRDAGPSPGSAGPRQAVTPGREAARVRGTSDRPGSGSLVGPGSGSLVGPGGGDRHVAAATGPGHRRDLGRLALAEATHPADHRSRPGADRPPRAVPRRRSATQDQARRDVPARCGRPGDDRGRQLRTAITRLGHALRAPASPAGRSRPASPPGPVALHRPGSRLRRRPRRLESP